MPPGCHPGSATIHSQLTQSLQPSGRPPHPLHMEWPPYPCGPIRFCTSHLYNMWTCHDATPQSMQKSIKVHISPLLKCWFQFLPCLGKHFLSVSHDILSFVSI